MRLRKISFLMLLLLPFLSCDTKKDFEDDFKNYFVKYYGEDGNQEGVDMFVNMDESVLLLGTTRLTSGGSRIMLIKTDIEGNIEWEKRLGGMNENARDIEQDRDGNFLILSNMLLGKDLISNENIYDLKVIKIAPNGVKLDSLVFGRNNNEWTTLFGNAITALTDGGFVVTGNSTDETIYSETLANPDQEDLITLVFNEDFSVRLVPVNTFAEYLGAGVKVIQRGTRYYLFGYSDKLDVSGSGDATYDLNFNVLEIIGEQLVGVDGADLAGTKTGQEILSDVVLDPFSNGYFEIGISSRMQPAISGELYFAKRNSSLILTSEGVLTGLAGNFQSPVVTPSSDKDGFIIAAKEVLATGSVMTLVRIDLNSDVEWKKSFGSVSNESSVSKVVQLENGRILILGTMGLETQNKMALIKVNPSGNFLN